MDESAAAAAALAAGAGLLQQDSAEKPEKPAKRTKKKKKGQQAQPLVRQVLFVHVRINRLHCRVTYQVCYSHIALADGAQLTRSPCLERSLYLCIFWPYLVWSCASRKIRRVWHCLLGQRMAGILLCRATPSASRTSKWCWTTGCTARWRAGGATCSTVSSGTPSSLCSSLWLACRGASSR